VDRPGLGGAIERAHGLGEGLGGVALLGIGGDADGLRDQRLRGAAARLVDGRLADGLSDALDR
jgi:hypothetical protein